MDGRFGLHSDLKSESDLLNYSAWPERFRAWMLEPDYIVRGSDK
jgi:hypothetical protein